MTIPQNVAVTLLCLLQSRPGKDAIWSTIASAAAAKTSSNLLIMVPWSVLRTRKLGVKRASGAVDPLEYLGNQPPYFLGLHSNLHIVTQPILRLFLTYLYLYSYLRVFSFSVKTSGRFMRKEVRGRSPIFRKITPPLFP